MTIHDAAVVDEFRVEIELEAVMQYVCVALSCGIRARRRLIFALTRHPGLGVGFRTRSTPGPYLTVRARLSKMLSRPRPGIPLGQGSPVSVRSFDSKPIASVASEHFERAGGDAPAAAGGAAYPLRQAGRPCPRFRRAG